MATGNFLLFLLKANHHLHLLCSPAPILSFSILLILLTPNTTAQTLPKYLNQTLSHTAQIIQTFNGTIQPPGWVCLYFSQITDSADPPPLGTWVNTPAGLHSTETASPRGTALAEGAEIRLPGALKGIRQA